MTHKRKIAPATSPLFCNRTSKTHAAANIELSTLDV